MQSNTHKRHALLELLEDVGGEYELMSYSGRAMYGERCLALTGDSLGRIVAGIVSACLVAGEDLAPKSREEIEQAVRGLRIDALGRSEVVYFPSVAYEGDEDEGDEGDLEEVG